MKCVYCNFHYEGSRMENDSRFCPAKRSVINENDTTCENFKPAPLFWCRPTDCWVDVNICTNRQSKEAEECKKCGQKRDILELRRAIGRKPKINIIKTEEPQLTKPKILIRR